MPTHQKVIWQEGMFLQPQHFQQQDRYLEYLISRHNFLSKSCHWGVSHLKINNDLLKLGKFGLIECSGILPDGTLLISRIMMTHLIRSRFQKEFAIRLSIWHCHSIDPGKTIVILSIRWILEMMFTIQNSQRRYKLENCIYD
jgi:hypothetical protein